MGFNFVAPNMSVKIGLQKMKEIAKQKNGKCLSTEYKNNQFPLIFQCSNKHTFQMQPYSLNIGRWCRKCYEDEIKLFKNKTIDNMKNAAKEYGGECLSKKYSGYTRKLLWECKNKHKWNATPWAVIRNKEWCDTCK